ncbi:MAG: T9SS type A sorting domain-containing protein [Bacteroidales bacterium]|nr:T9SS type A sorting domain-containing protein [Bacteroidales bacterium]
MRHKKLKVSAVLLLGLGLTSLQAQTMYVKESSGSQTAYALSNVRKMTFSGGNATVQKTDNTTGVYSLSGLQYLSFEDYITSIEGQIQLDNPNFSAYPNPVNDLLNIDLTGVESLGTISILTFEGKLLQEQKTDGAKMVTLNLSQLPPGIYLC